MLFRLYNCISTSQKESCRVFCLTTYLIGFLFQQVFNNTVKEALVSWNSHMANIPGGISLLTLAKLYQFALSDNLAFSLHWFVP